MIEQSVLIWGFALLLAALLLVVLEVFVPSAGLIGLTAGVCAVSAVVVFWRAEPWWGVTSLLLILVLAPLALNFALRVMPHTPVGKRLILTDTQAGADPSHDAGAKESVLLGAVGVALTPMHPVGTAEIEGTRLEVLAEGGAIEAGQRVRVTGVDGNQVKVRALA